MYGLGPKTYKRSSHTHTCVSPVIDHLSMLFFLEGITLEVFTNNGLPFNVQQWSQFAEKEGFKHTTLSSHYSLSNVFIEMYVRIPKNALTKAKAIRISILKVLKQWHVLIATSILSPTEILHHRPAGPWVLKQSSVHIFTSSLPGTHQLAGTTKSSVWQRKEGQRPPWTAHRLRDPLHVH